MLLSISYDEAALFSRNHVLQQGGNEVVTTTNLSEAVRLFSETHFEAAILGDSIPLIERVLLIDGFRRTRPEMPILCVCRGHADFPGDLHVVCVDKFSPELLLKTLRECLNRDASAHPA